MELAAKQDRDFEILSVIAPGLQVKKQFKTFQNGIKNKDTDIPVLYIRKQLPSKPTTWVVFNRILLIDSQGKSGKIHLVISNVDGMAFKEMKKKKIAIFKIFL